MPKQRPAAMARSQRRLVEKGPSGVSASNSRFERIWMPVRRTARRRSACGGVSLPAALMWKSPRPLVAIGAGQRHEQQQRVHPRLVPARGEQAQRIDRAVDPEIVRIDREKGIGVDQGQRPLQPAAGFQQLLALIRDCDFNAFDAILEMGFERAGEIVDVDHRLGRRPPPSGGRGHGRSSALPATSISGLGRVAVSGRMRLPRPAAITIAVLGTAAAGSGRSASGLR